MAFAKIFCETAKMLHLVFLLAFIALPACGSDKGDFARFERSLNNTPHGFQIIADPTGTPPCARIERFEVRAGDCATNGLWSDCRTNRERSELSEFDSRSFDGDEAWYGFSVYLPDDWPDVWPTKTVIAQWHQQRQHVVWMLLHQRGSLVLDNQSGGTSSERIELMPADQLRGRWWRIEMHAKWSTGKDGQIRLYVNGEQMAERRGPNMTATKVYFKYGVYRSFISRYGHPVPTQTAYFADVRKAKNREGLAK